MRDRHDAAVALAVNPYKVLCFVDVEAVGVGVVVVVVCWSL